MSRPHRAWHGVAGVVCLLAGLAPLMGSGTTASAAFPGTDGVVAFQQGPNTGPSAVFSVAPDGSQLRRLRGGAAPVFSPDGKRIAFTKFGFGGFGVGGVLGTRGGGVLVMSASGSQSRPVTAPPFGKPMPKLGSGWAEYCGDGDPSFSPGGLQIAFERDCFAIHHPQAGFSPRFLTEGIFAVDSDGSHLRQLTSRRGLRSDDATPVFSPDGRSIAFTREGANDREIFIMNADGSNVHKLTHRLDTGSLNPVGGWSDSPDFSPDGSLIAFVRNHNYTLTVCPPPPHSCRTSTRPATDVFVMNADGSNVRQVTDASKDGFPDPQLGSATPAFSPDGKQIVAARYTSLQKADLFIFNADGSGLRRFTNTGRYSAHPSWQPLP
jgi:Tol biopolymer transport system component